jgi:hypothetical protein
MQPVSMPAEGIQPKAAHQPPADAPSLPLMMHVEAIDVIGRLELRESDKLVIRDFVAR